MTTTANYRERAEEAWDELSLGEKLHELDEDSVRDFAASLGLEDWCQYPDSNYFRRAMPANSPYTERGLAETLDVLHAWCKEHKRFAAWLDRETERQRTLSEEPDDHSNND